MERESGTCVCVSVYSTGRTCECELCVSVYGSGHCHSTSAIPEECVNARVGMSIVLEESVNANSVCPCVGVSRVPEETCECPCGNVYSTGKQCKREQRVSVCGSV